MLVVAFVLAGCGGDPFTGFDAVALDARIETDGGLGGAPGGGAGGSGGAIDVDSGVGINSGGSSSGGASSASGGVSAATGGTATCALVTHNNGLGQTWQDCVSLGTYNETQATKACKASVSVQCVILDYCGGYTMRGYDVAGMFIAEWGYGGTTGGHVAVGDGQGNYYGSACNGGPGSSTWN